MIELFQAWRKQIFILAMLVLMSSFACERPLRLREVKVVRGQAVVENYQPAQDLLHIVGQWEVFDDKLVEPFDTNQKPDRYLDWDEKSAIDVNTNEIGNRQKTYRAYVEFRQDGQLMPEVELRLDSFVFLSPCGSKQTYFNGKAICKTISDKSYPVETMNGSYYYKGPGRIELLWQFNKTNFAQSTRFTAPTLGSINAVDAGRSLDESIGGLVTGACFMLMIFSVIAFFLNREKNRIAITSFFVGLGLMIASFALGPWFGRHYFMSPERWALTLCLGLLIVMVAYVEAVIIFKQFAAKTSRLRFIYLSFVGATLAYQFSPNRSLGIAIMVGLLVLGLVIIACLSIYLIFRGINTETKVMAIGFAGLAFFSFLSIKGDLFSDHLYWAMTFLSFPISYCLMLGLYSRRDLQETRAAKNVISEQKTKLERLDKLKDEFLANTSHELRTPLNGITGLAEALLYDQSLSESQIKKLHLILNSSHALTRHVDDILDYSKLKNQNIKFKFASVDIKSAVNVAISILSVLADKKNLQLNNEVFESCPRVKADEDRLIQIFCNLIGNAIKFTKSGSITIKAEGEQTSEGSTQYQKISVIDTGIGISESDYSKVFSAFEQTEGQASREYSGTGLGLSITKSLIEGQGGKIGLKSTLNQGSNFYFTLPLADASDELINPVESSGISKRLDVIAKDQAFTAEKMEINSSNSKPKLEPLMNQNSPQSELDGDKYASFKGAKVLCVDDDTVNLSVLESILEAYNIEFKNYTDPLLAIDLLEKDQYRPHMVLLDVMMPKMTGYEFLQRVRSKFNSGELPVILLTARTQTKDMLTGLELGANDYLHKPIHRDELLARMNSLIDLSRLTNELDRKIYERTNDIISILSNINEGLCTIDENGTISNRYSPYLERVFEQNKLAGQNLFDLLEAHSNLDLTIIDQVKNAIGISVHAPKLMFAANSHLLPHELTLTINGAKKDVEIHYDPVADIHDKCFKVLIAMRDVTEKNLAKQKEKRRDKKLHMIEDIVEIGVSAFSERLEHNLKYIDDSLSRLDKALDESQVRLIFRNIHTLKGNVHLLGFRESLLLIHQCEGLLRLDFGSDESNRLYGDDLSAVVYLLRKVREDFSEYEDILIGLTGEQAKSAEHESILNRNEELIHNHEKVEYFDCIYKKKNYRSLEEILELEMSHAEILSQQLGIERPNFRIEDNQVLIAREKASIISDILAHFIRNSLDHGFKSEDGLVSGVGVGSVKYINIQLSMDANALLISYSDNGKGLNLDALRTPLNQPDQELALKIFEDGKSTKDSVTLISGRGVGLSWVKSAIEHAKGSINIEFTNDLVKGHRQFQYKVILPKTFAVR